MLSNVSFHDHKPENLSLYDAVVQGLSQESKMIPPKFFYDAKGSQLFDAICNQPEYYLPDIEQGLYKKFAGEIASHTGTGRVVIEPGAGSLQKIRLLLDALAPSAYVPMDISGEYLRDASHKLADDYPWLKIHAACVDFTHSLPLPAPVPEQSKLAFFPGSSLGNFHREEAQIFLHMIAQTVGTDGMLLIGVDTKKPPVILDAAYNDEAGVTAEFNLNLLHRIENELDAEVDKDGFDHHAYYNRDEGRVEMHLVSKQEQVVKLDEHQFRFFPGETVHTECSYKYTPDEFFQLASDAGFREVDHWLADDELFAIYLLAVE